MLLLKILVSYLKLLQKQKSSTSEQISFSLFVTLWTFLQYLRRYFLNIIRIT